MSLWNASPVTQAQLAATDAALAVVAAATASAASDATHALAAAAAAQSTADAAVPADQRPSTAGQVTVLTGRPWETNASTLVNWPKDQWRCVRTHIKDAWTIAGLGVVTTVAAVGGTATLIFGIWAVGPTGLPAARVADWGALGGIDLTAAPGTLTLSAPGLAIAAGEYYVGCAWTGTAVTGPTVSSHTGLVASSSSNTGASTGYRYDASGGSVPDPFVPLVTTTAGVIVLAVLA